MYFSSQVAHKLDDLLAKNYIEYKYVIIICTSHYRSHINWMIYLLKIYIEYKYVIIICTSHHRSHIN